MSTLGVLSEIHEANAESQNAHATGHLDLRLEDAEDLNPPAKEQLFARGHDGSVYEFHGNFEGLRDFDLMLEWAADRKASDINIQTDEHIKCDFGGEICPITHRALTKSEVEDITRYIYGEHALSMLILGKDLDPSHEVRMKDGVIKRYRVNCTSIRIPGASGIQITIRTLPTAPIQLSKLNIEKEIVANKRPNQGLVLITGPTGSGKSTLLSSLVRDILEKEDAHEKFLEYSAPIEYVFDGIEMPSSIVAQTEVGRHLRVPDDLAGEVNPFAYAIRNALRRKPTIIQIGEARDRETIQGCVEAALTGHVVYTTMHTIGVAETISRMLSAFHGSERHSMAQDIMQSLRLVVTQLLYDRKGGGKVGCREYMVFDKETRSKFMNTDIDQWANLAKKLLQSKKVVGRSMSHSAYLLYEKGDMDVATWKAIAASERGSS